MQNQPEIVSKIIKADSVRDQKAKRVQLWAGLGLSQPVKSRQKVLVYPASRFLNKLLGCMQIWEKNEYSASAAEAKN